MTFDPFGDAATRGYLRNLAGVSDPATIRRLEHHAFSANVHTALDALRQAPAIGYEQILATHKTLFGSVYPWAGQDRATLAPDIAIARAGIADLFAHPRDVRRAADYALELASNQAVMRAQPGVIFGTLAYAHPFLDGNGRSLLTVHAELACRADFHIAWQNIAKEPFLTALTAELRQPGSAMDALIAPHIRPGAMPLPEAAATLRENPGLRMGPPVASSTSPRPSPSPSPSS